MYVNKDICIKKYRILEILLKREKSLFIYNDTNKNCITENRIGILRR